MFLTLTVPPETAVGIGAGPVIVADSDPVSEDEELLVKIAPILECLCQESDTRSEEQTPYAEAAQDAT